MLLMIMTVLSWLTACKKDPNKTVIQGHVTAYGTNKPVPGARIYLWCYNGEILGPTSSTFVDSLDTDATGSFHTEYRDRDLCGGIYLSAYKEGYYYKNDLDIHSGVNNLEIVLDPEAWLKIVTVPDAGNHHIVIGGDFLGAAGFDVYSTHGSQVHLFPTRGNRTKQISWRPWGELDKTVFDSVFVSGLDTTTFVVHY